MRTIVLGVKYFFLSKSQIISIIVNYIYIYIFFFFSRSCQIIRLVEKSGGKYQPADSLLIHQPNNPSCLSLCFFLKPNRSVDFSQHHTANGEPREEEEKITENKEQSRMVFFKPRCQHHFRSHARSDL